MAAPYQSPSEDDVKAYGRAVMSGVPGGRQQQLNTSALGAPQAAPPARGGLRGLRDWLGITILGADGARVLFPPQQPLQPIAQFPDQAALGRPWDYPVGYNTRVMPRDGQPVGFAMLKNLAVGYDLLAIMINRVKDKIVSQNWDVVMKDEKATPDEGRMEEIEAFLEYPDRERTFDDWTRMLLDQVIMYDAPAIWLRPDRGGKLYSLEILDGSLITPKIGPDGRVPTPDLGPAYQQVLKGLPAVDYIKPVPRGAPVPTDPEGYPYPELLYRPKNPRVDSLYGYGPVEQIITTVNIALRREAYLLSYYTDGSMPDLLVGVPETWNPNQIAAFQAWWDSVLRGNLGERRGTKFVPGGLQVHDTKEKALTDQTDEWLVRICCFSLGLNPMPFLKQMNRGQEKTHHDEAAQEGLEPWLEWLANLLNVIIALKFGYRDIIFRWKEDEATNELERAQIDKIMVDAKIYHPDEIRAKRGDEPMSDEMREQMNMAAFAETANATVLSPEQQQAQNEHALALAAAKPAPVVASKPTEKIEAPVNHFKFEAPQITMPAITISPPAIHIAPAPVNVTLPEMKQADVFVDIGATNVQAKFEQPQPKPKTVTRTIKAERGPDGKLRGEIVKTITAEQGADGSVEARIE